MIDYSFDPVVDAGLCALTLLAGKQRVQDLASSDLDVASKKLVSLYADNFKKPLATRVQFHVMMNSPIYNGAKAAEGVVERMAEVANSWRHDEAATAADVRCVFFPHLKARHYADRSMFPLLSADACINYSNRRGGVPISGLAVLAAHASVLTMMQVGGRLLIAHDLRASEDNMTFTFAREFYNRNRKQMLLGDTLADLGKVFRSQFINWTLRQEVLIENRLAEPTDLLGVELFVFSSGKNLSVERVRFSGEALGFLSAVARTRKADWVTFALQFNDKEGQRENWLYRLLCELPAERYRLFSLLTSRRCDQEIVRLYLQEVIKLDKVTVEMCEKLVAQVALVADKKDYYAFRSANGSKEKWMAVLTKLREHDQRTGGNHMTEVGRLVPVLMRNKDWRLLAQYMLYLMLEAFGPADNDDGAEAEAVPVEDDAEMELTFE